VEAALSFARTVVEKRGRVSDAGLEAVRRAGYSDGEIIDIIALVAVNLLTNYVNLVAGTDIDFPVVTTSEVAVA
jgi:alkylhydroperoxidase family enzyme